MQMYQPPMLPNAMPGMQMALPNSGADLGFLPPLPASNLALPISGSAPQMPVYSPATSSPPNPNYINDILQAYGGQQQDQAQRGGFIQNILSSRLQPDQGGPTREDNLAADYQNTLALGAPNSFKSTTPLDVAADRAKLQLAPFTTLAALQRGSSQMAGGGTGMLANRLMSENPGMSFQSALQQVQTGFRQGTQYDASGNIIATPGVAQAKGDIARGEQTGKEQAKLGYAAPIAQATAQGNVTGRGEITPMDTFNKGKNQVTKMVSDLSAAYDNLDTLGGAINTNNNAFQNMGAAFGNSPAGQAIGKNLGTPTQSVRNQIEQARPLLINAIRSATGMSAKAMDSNAELQFYLKAATDPTLDIQANKTALKKLDELYGLSSPPLNGDPNAAMGASVNPPAAFVAPSLTATHRFNPQTGQVEAIQ